MSRKRRIGFALIFLMAVAGYGGCGGSSTGGSGGSGGSEPEIANGLSLPAGTNALVSVRAASGGSLPALALGGVELETFLLCLEEIEIETEETAEDGDTEIDLVGPFVVHLVEGGAIVGTVENLGPSTVIIVPSL